MKLLFNYEISYFTAPQIAEYNTAQIAIAEYNTLLAEFQELYYYSGRISSILQPKPRRAAYARFSFYFQITITFNSPKTVKIRQHSIFQYLQNHLFGRF